MHVQVDIYNALTCQEISTAKSIYGGRIRTGESTFLLLSQAEIERSDSNNVINENEFGFTISLAEKHELSSAGAFTVASIILSAILSLLF